MKITNNLNVISPICFKENSKIDIVRFLQVDKTLYRGGKPNEKQLESLKTIGIDTIIDFSTGYGAKTQGRTEKQITENLKMNYINLPFPSFENPPEEYIAKFFDIVEEARNNGKKVFIHCTHGKDRTGLFAGMYKLKYGLDNIENVVNEMLTIGHDSNANPNLIPFLKDYCKSTDLNLSHSNVIGKSLILNKIMDTSHFVNEFLKEDILLKSAKQLIDRYPELKWLTGNVNATPEGKMTNNINSISENLFGNKHIEFDRTIVGINCLKQVLNNDYEGFTKCQKDNVKLTPENFEQLRDFTLSVLKTPEDIDAMISYTVINDLGKIKEFVTNIEKSTGKKVKDHDEALLIALKVRPNKIPSFNRLSDDYKNNILNGLSADFNLGQFVQAECLERNLTGLKNVTEKARNLYLTHMFYDVAGAAGHVNPNGSLVMTNPVYKGYIQGINAIKEINHSSEIEVYNKFLKEKAEDLQLPMQNIKDRALVKLAVMSRASNPQEAQNVILAFSKLSQDEQINLINGINGNGIDSPGTLLYYAPAFIQNCINAGDKREMLEKAYKVISRIYKQNANYKNDVNVLSLANIANAIKSNSNLTVDELYQLFITG